MYEFKESDWKQFRKILENVRERYLIKRNEEIRKQLTNPGKTATEQFWDTLDIMKKEAKNLHDCLDGYSRSRMELHILLMRNCGMLTDDDLEVFSEELQNHIIKVEQTI